MCVRKTILYHEKRYFSVFKTFRSKNRFIYGNYCSEKDRNAQCDGVDVRR